MQKTMEEIAKERGFTDLGEFNTLVANADMTTEEKIRAFILWKDTDGSKEGLLKLQPAQRISKLLFELMHTLQQLISRQVAIQLSVDQSILIYRIIIDYPETGTHKAIPVYINMNKIDEDNLSDEELFSKIFKDIIEELDKPQELKTSRLHIVKG